MSNITMKRIYVRLKDDPDIREIIEEYKISPDNKIFWFITVQGAEHYIVIESTVRIEIDKA